MLIVLIMLSLLGILYGVGMGFGINKLVTFVKNEYAETLANVIIIVIVMVGGFGLFNNSAVFLSNIAIGAVSSSGAKITSPISSSLTTQNIYVGICDYYNTDLIGANFNNYVGVIYELFVLNVMLTTDIKVMPNGFGLSFAPFYGGQTLRTNIWSEEAMSFSLLEMGGMLIIMLFIIYFLFPLFFYAGIALRTLPWTRAAGGSLIALFISFYIIFPALLYAFASIPYVNPNTGLCQSTSASQYSLCNGHSAFSSLGHATSEILETGFSYFTSGGSFGTAMLNNVKDFTNEITYSALQFFGVIISFIISYDLLEFLGDFLGSPSLQSNRVLSKLV